VEVSTDEVCADLLTDEHLERQPPAELALERE
jgi:hypothetical protein